jgi:beta-galactosidase/evolved beta-galactosidase subunit alpha
MTLNFKGEELIIFGPRVNIWRAPIDNDIPNMLEDWKKHEMDKLVPKILGVQVDKVEKGVQVQVQGYLQAEEGMEKTEFSIGYLVIGDGSVKVTSTILPPPIYTWLPRTGVRLQLPQSMNRVKWFGRGPHENYRDRNEGAMVGIYEMTIDELFEPYIVPQENGNRSEIRWVEVSNANMGIKITSDKMFEFSANRHDIADLEEADHLYKLEKKPYVNLYLDQMQAGLGSAGCGPDTLFKYRVKSEPHTWSFSIKPIIPFLRT